MKKFLLWLLAVCVTATAITAGTIAYLTHEEKAVNVMTMGNVIIDQIEQERTNNGLDDFSQYQNIYPAVIVDYSSKESITVGDYDDIMIRDQVNNYIDKIVSVKNTGVNPAYVRTIYAIPEAGNFNTTYNAADQWLHWNGVSDTDTDPNNGWIWGRDQTTEWPGNTDNWDVVENVTIDGKVYDLYVVTNKNVIAPEEQTAPSFLGFYIDSKVDYKDGHYTFGDYDLKDISQIEILVATQATQVEGFKDAWEALDASFGDITSTNHPWYGEEIELPSKSKVWDGTSDTSWYNDADSEFIITTPEQLAGLAELVDGGNTFEGKTIKLGEDIDLGVLDENDEPICFEPIGSYRNDTAFKGTFDGQNHTIANMSQNTWALDNGYSYGDLGLGLFGKVEDATIENLNMDNASISGESGLCGIVAAAAYGDCTFENITVSNSDVADYQYYSGGIVGWASGNHQYINCDVDESTTVGGQWGDFNNANGGIIGGISSTGTFQFEDCDIACVLDAHNDVVSAYEWYSYRRTGMLIGDTGQTQMIDGTTYAAAENVTCKNVTVTYGDWANYHYCQFSNMNYPWVRVEAGISNSAYSNIRYGHPTDANGNEVVDDNHVHAAGDKHHELIVLDQLFGGKTGDRYCTYGTATHDGVTVIYNNK